MAKKQLLKRAEAARHLDIGIRTLDTLTLKGILPVCRIGRSVRYREASLDAFIEANESRMNPRTPQALLMDH